MGDNIRPVEAVIPSPDKGGEGCNRFIDVTIWCSAVLSGENLCYLDSFSFLPPVSVPALSPTIATLLVSFIKHFGLFACDVNFW